MQQHESGTASRRVVTIIPDARMAEELEPMLRAQLPDVPRSGLATYPHLRDLSQVLGRAPNLLIFLDASSDPDRALELLVEISRQGGSAKVVALLSGNDPEFILRCLRAGAAEFLMAPFMADQLDVALNKLARLTPHAYPSGREPGRMFAVMPAKGACGASTVACNLAFQWKRMGAKRVLLADLDPLTGTMSFLLKIKSTFSFLDAMQRSHELDQDLWNAMVTPVNGVDVLLAPELMAEGAHDLRDPSPILDYARHAYDVVVLDAASVYGPWNLNQARAASEVVLVTTNELPALQAAQRALSYLDTNRIGRWKIRLVVNRYSRDIGLSREVIGTALHTDVFDSLPSDFEGVQKALLEGRPLLPATPFGKAMMTLAEHLSGRQEGVKKPSSLSGLLSLFSRTSK